ncbi:hypothetical protein [Haloarcula salina]|uniref:Uncharacterized protein n=1 Tax=Haloarcula salina TaxID=1429914 RepID=A0AA41FXH7_9EURY|nr:hypothetical protein [Haloarcula salina]MBV0900620.1 hypothetical protein [Haloarcula salina]
MPSIISDAIFSEPSGRRHAAVMFGGALALALLYAYSALVGQSASIAVLFLLAGAALSGVAELLPSDRRLAAGGLRLTGILVLVCLLALVVVAPELVAG